MIGRSPYVVLGAGGHARVVVDTLSILGHNIKGCVAPLKPEQPIAACPWLGDEAEQHFTCDEIMLANGIGSVGPVQRRRDTFLSWHLRGFCFPPIIHPNATISRDVKVGDGAIVMAGSVMQSGAQLAENVLVNTNATIDHDSYVGAHSHISTGAIVCGHVAVGECVHVGAGATIIQGVQIADNAVIGAGAVVLNDVPRGALIVGVPARVVKR